LIGKCWNSKNSVAVSIVSVNRKKNRINWAGCSF